MSSRAAPEPTLPAADTAARVRLAVTRLARLMRQQNDGSLSQSLVSALAMVEKFGPLTLGELATIEQVAPPSITKVVEKLEHLGCVVRSQDPDDRRVYRLTITEAGHAQLEKHRALGTAWLADRLAALPRDDIEQLDVVLLILEHLTNPPVPDGSERA
jgi:DNA-binding MarR family transcriptional regulator